MFSATKINRLFSRCCNIYHHSCKGIYQRPYYLSPPLYYSVQVENRIEDKLLSVKWSDGKSVNYPHIYLRDNCPCPSCYNAQTLQRLSSNLILDNYATATIKTAHIDQDKDELHVEWINDSQHSTSSYQLDWLKARQFASEDENRPFRIHRRLWDNSTQNNIPRFDFNDIVNHKPQLYQWLQSLLKNGIVAIDNVPKELGQVRKLADQISFLHRTCYGEDFIIEVNSEDVTKNAYMNARLPMHTDLAYCPTMPGILLLHCITEANFGGESLYSDGFKAAELLRESHPEYFDLLTTYSLQYVDAEFGKDSYYHQALHPVISVYHTGEIKKICYGDHMRALAIDVPNEKLSTFYKAIEQFLKYLYHADHVIEYKIKSGSMITVDNFRIVHGRTEFKLSPDNNHRYLQGGFLDWGEALSRMRMTEKECNMDSLTPSI